LVLATISSRWSSASTRREFELTNAPLCADGPVKILVDLALAPEHRRGHGAL
jgi:hypothetical protein